MVHGVDRRGEKRPPQGEEGMCRGTERDVVMKAVPGTPFKVIEAEFALQFLVIPLDPPTQLAELDQGTE